MAALTNANVIHTCRTGLVEVYVMDTGGLSYLPVDSGDVVQFRIPDVDNKVAYLAQEIILTS